MIMTRSTPDSTRYLGCVTGRRPAADDAPLIGILEGEGIGPELIACCRLVLGAIEARTAIRFRLRQGGLIGKVAMASGGEPLSGEVIGFCGELFRDGGALLCGPGGDRFVYELRREFSLFCKLVPLQPLPPLADTGPLRPDAVQDVDILLVRENLGGLYQGEFHLETTASGGHASHRFGYTTEQVSDILETAVRLARARRGELCVVTKPGGAPSISRLWETEARRIAGDAKVDLRILEIDNASYQMVADARAFDVVVAPNLFGDVLGDGAALLLASRGMSYSANFNHAGHAVYQTGHGAAHDLAGTDRANPLGQLLSLAMMLHESFGQTRVAQALLAAIDDTLAAGWRTRDIAAPGARVVGTRALAEQVADRMEIYLRADLRTSA
jgi:3-isopropylmalate dehydrogenase